MWRGVINLVVNTCMISTPPGFGVSRDTFTEIKAKMCNDHPPQQAVNSYWGATNVSKRLPHSVAEEYKTDDNLQQLFNISSYLTKSIWNFKIYWLQRNFIRFSFFNEINYIHFLTSETYNDSIYFILFCVFAEFLVSNYLK